LIDGVRLPESELYTVRIPHQAFGTSYTIRNLQQAIADFRFTSGYPGELVVSAISRRGGRRLPPHRSHQSGRDVDIWLPTMPHARAGRKPGQDEIDWHASWLLIQALARTGAIKRIYLDNSNFRRLRRASKEYGVSWEQFCALVGGSALVWHSPGHDSHIHVRFKCTPGVRRCRE
jgi:murein endopeptidase